MLQDYPYLTEIYNKKIETSVIGLIQAISKNYISYYSYNDLKPLDKERFIRLVENWWKKEPSIPISLYYQGIFDQFNYCKSCLSNNDYIILDGFEGIKLKNLSEKRIKRKLIHLEDRK